MGILDNFKTMWSGGKLDVAKRFEVLRHAISGTMSKFYQVRDRETDEIFGLKICDVEKTNFFEGRFQGLAKPPEGEIASQFDHPRIVKTHSYGTTTLGEHYVLMEYLPGPGLNAVIKQRSSLLDGNRLNLVRHMAEALAELHKAEYIHRDICPRNFICAKDCSSLKMIDFGLTVPATKAFMQPGNRTGTPNYMAPEIIRRRMTDQRLDIFSFGVTAYQLCTHELPWPSQDTSGKAAVAHANHDPDDIFAHNPQLDPTLGKAIMQCLAREPSGRPASAQAFLDMVSGVESERNG